MNVRSWGHTGAAVGVAAFFALQALEVGVPYAWAALTLSGAIAAFAGTLDLDSPFDRLDAAFAGVLGACVLSAARGVDPARSFTLSVPILGAVLLWLMLRRAQPAARVRRGAGIGLGLCALIQAGALLAATSVQPTAGAAAWVEASHAAWLVVPNDIGWIACVLPWIASVLAPRWPARLALALGVGYIALCVLLGSRSGAVAGVGGLAAFAFLSRAPRMTLRRAAIAGAVAVVALVVAAAFAPASMRARWQLWQSAWSLFLQHPLSGYGLHDFVLGYREHAATVAWIDDRITPWPHNLWLEMLAECGVIGIGATLVLIALVVRQGMDDAAACRHAAVEPLVRAAYSGLFGMLLLSLVEASLLRQWVWLCASALLALAAGATARESDVEVDGIEDAAQLRVRDAA